ncbi:MAG: ATP-binding protein [Armatimonadetes bacterium]|nr:ATP-binding protein [Armatimonadota bacterium]
MYIHRVAEKIIHTLLDGPKVIIVLGARQVGKTTLIEHILRKKNSLILNFDIEVDKSRVSAASSLPPLEGMLALGNPSILVIDEAQRLPEAGKTVKGWYDARVPAKIILLGSSSLNLLDQAAESLTGRNEKVYLPPLTFEEVIRSRTWHSPRFTSEILKKNFSNQIQSILLQLIVYGSYPETILTSNKERYLINLASDYLLKDILQSSLVKSPELVKKLLMLVAYQAGSEVSINELASNLQISRQTVERYLELLERTFVIFRLPAFSKNQRKEIVKSTKIFFWDNGVRNALLKEFSLSPYRGDIGSLWENWVIAEFAKRNLLEDQRHNLYFWRTRDGSEVNLVIKTGTALMLI